MKAPVQIIPVFSLLCLFLFSGCSHYTVNKEGFIRPPAKYKFPYRKKVSQLNSNELIDTTVVYVLKNSNVYRDNDEYKNHEHYIRFYADGRFKEQGIKKGLKLEEVNNINCGIVGYYYLKGRVLRMQYYTDLNAGSDQLKAGRVDVYPSRLVRGLPLFI